MSYGCSGNNVPAAAKCGNTKTEIQSEVKYKLSTNRNIKNTNLFLSNKLVCSQLMGFCYRLPTTPTT